MEEIERTLLVKPEVFVYKIGPRPSARGYRAADWNLTAPDWTGRLRCSTRGKKCTLNLEDKNSGQLFAACPVEHYPGSSVEAVTDSSRYFVICVQDSGRKAFLGMGFADRSDSFDLNVALQDHFKWVKKEDGFAKEAELPPAKKLDLAFKEGQTIRINIPKKDAGGDFDDSEPAAAVPSGAKSRPKAKGSMGLPPPPGGVKIGPPPGASNLTPMQSPTEPSRNVIGGAAPSSNADLLGDLLGGGLSLSSSAAAATQPSSSSLLAGNSNLLGSSSTAAAPASGGQKDPFGDDPWGDFASAPAAAPAASGNWTSFE